MNAYLLNAINSSRGDLDYKYVKGFQIIDFYSYDKEDTERFKKNIKDIIDGKGMNAALITCFDIHVFDERFKVQADIVDEGFGPGKMDLKIALIYDETEDKPNAKDLVIRVAKEFKVDDADDLINFFVGYIIPIEHMRFDSDEAERAAEFLDRIRAEMNESTAHIFQKFREKLIEEDI